MATTTSAPPSPRPDDYEMSSSPGRPEVFINERISFTADSPYFTAYVESEQGQLQLLTETLEDISSRTKTFVRTGALMSEAARRLARSCRLRQEDADNEDEQRLAEDAEAVGKRKQAVGDEMAKLLELLAEVRHDSRSKIVLYAH